MAGARAAPPSNDNFANATVITSVPFADTVDITEATTEPGEPIANPGEVGRTVWYSFTPSADGVAQIGPPFSPPSPSPPTQCDLRSYRFLVVYRADSDGFVGLVPIAGSQWSSARVYTVQVQAGTNYYIQGGQTWALNCGQNTFSLSVNVAPRPRNDNFADAITFTTVPLSDSRDLTGATVEPGEPTACNASITGSVWYAFTPMTSGSYGGFGITGINVYTGTSLADLTSVACPDWPGLYFYADAGTTYYLQYYGGGMRIDVVPPPLVGFTYSPDVPSIYDDVSFRYDTGGYWDPTVTGYAWDFGDGATATGSPTFHRFTTDGDYAVTLTVSARGGRTNSQTQVVHVRTTKVSGHGRFGTEGDWGRVDFALSNEQVTFDRGTRFSFSGKVESVTGQGKEATLSGTGSWNGQSGYAFSVSVVDNAPWGVNKDTIDVVVHDPAGAIVLTSFGPKLPKQGDISVTPASG